MGKPPPTSRKRRQGQGHRGTKDALSSPVASVMPTGAAAPWGGAGSRLAGGRGALRVWGGGVHAPRAGADRGADGRPACGVWRLYPFGYRVYPSGVN